MHDWRPRRGRVSTTGRRLLPVAAVVLAAAVPCASADAHAVSPLRPTAAPGVDVIGDSVVSGQPLGSSGRRTPAHGARPVRPARARDRSASPGLWLEGFFRDLLALIGRLFGVFLNPPGWSLA
ncbi:MAG: hypothetical protein JWN32_1601 [Solirubrobacterales bacterium]|nr:hypothetical protein [Solirubrobacterales bacterium]